MATTSSFGDLAAAIVKNSEWYARKHDVAIDEHFAAYQLIKEIGQFTDAIMHAQNRVRRDQRITRAEAKDSLTQELVDIVALALINAHLYDIDIEAGLRERWLSKTGT